MRLPLALSSLATPLLVALACGDGKTVYVICGDAGPCLGAGGASAGGSGPDAGGASAGGSAQSGGSNGGGVSGSGDGGSNSAGVAGVGGSQTAGGSAGASAGGAAGSNAGGSAGAAAGGAATMFFDDFEDGVADGWTNETVGVVGTPMAIWAVIAGASSQVYNQSVDTDTSSRIAYVSGTWTDMTVEARVKMNTITGASSSNYTGVCGHYLDNNNYYCGALRHDGQFSLRARLAGSTNTLGAQVDVVPPVGTGVWYTIKLVFQGGTVSGYLDGALLTSESATTVPSGGIALITSGTSADYDDVRVTVP